MIYIAGISIALFFELLLINKKQKTLSDKIMIVWILLIVIHLYLFYLVHSSQNFTYPFLLGIEQGLPLFYGIFLFFYVGATVEIIPKKKWVILAHFLPIIVCYLYLINFFSLPTDQKIYVYENQGAGFENFMKVKTILFPLHGLLYIYWTLNLLKKHSLNIRLQFSNLDNINLNWLRMLIYGTGCLWILVLFLPENYIFIAIAFFVFIISYFGIKQDPIFSNGKLEQIPNIPKDSETIGPVIKKYSKSGLTKEHSEKIYEKLIHVFSKEKLYADCELTLADLASKLETKSNYLSQIINEKEGANFFDFVNSYRLKAFLDLVSDQKHQKLTVLGMAYDCGFSSKSSFNRYFKKIMQKTPTEYIKGFSN